MRYDYLVVGAGLFGSVFACEANKRGKKCLVIDRRPHIGGNVYTSNIEGVNVHMYGAHIFHTSDSKVWNYVNRFAEFNNYVNCPIARYKNETYNLPFNMNTFTRLWSDVFTPEQAKSRIAEQVKKQGITNPRNLEEQALSLVGEEIYVKLIKGYTEKQWGRDCRNLPSFIIKRLPLRFTYDNNYFNDRYQGIPVGGYTQMVEKMLDGIDVRLNVDYKDVVNDGRYEFNKVVYTGAIDEFFHYRLGKLQYRTVKFDTKVLDIPDFQGNAVVNYTEREVPYTRIIEHKHFEFGSQPKTVISYEYPMEWNDSLEPYYPVNDEQNTALFAAYKNLAKTATNVIFGGRLGAYTYYDMDKVIEKALQLVNDELGDEQNSTQSEE